MMMTVFPAEELSSVVSATKVLDMLLYASIAKCQRVILSASLFGQLETAH